MFFPDWYQPSPGVYSVRVTLDPGEISFCRALDAAAGDAATGEYPPAVLKMLERIGPSCTGVNYWQPREGGYEGEVQFDFDSASFSAIEGAVARLEGALTAFFTSR